MRAHVFLWSFFVCACTHRGAGRAPARVRACGDTKESRRTHHGEEKRRGQRDRGRKEGEARSAKEGRESPRSDEKVSEPQPRSRIPHLKFDSTSSRRGESSMSGKTKGKEDKDHATKGQSCSNPIYSFSFYCVKESGWLD